MEHAEVIFNRGKLKRLFVLSSEHFGYLQHRLNCLFRNLDPLRFIGVDDMNKLPSWDTSQPEFMHGFGHIGGCSLQPPRQQRHCMLRHFLDHLGCAAQCFNEQCLFILARLRKGWGTVEGMD